MADYFVSNTVGNVSEDGSQNNPYLSLSSLHTALGGVLTGHTIRLAGGDTFDENVNADATTKIWTGDNWTLDSWQPPNRYSLVPTITRAKRDLTWSLVSGNVYTSSALASEGYGGCILEDGLALNWKDFADTGVQATDLATTVASMTAGTASYNFYNNQYLVYPRTGTPSSHVYAATAGLYLFQVQNAASFNVRNIKFELSSAGLKWGEVSTASLRGGYLVEDIEIANCGGAHLGGTGGFLSGNGLGVISDSGANGDSLFRNSVIRDIFDSGYSPQLYGNNTTLKNLHAKNIYIYRCGLSGVELSMTGSVGTQITSTMENVTVQDCHVYDTGYGWRGLTPFTGFGMNVQTNNSNAGVLLRNILLKGNYISGAITAGMLLHQTNGNNVVARDNYITNCPVGLVNTSRAGYPATTNKVAKYNVINNCNTGIELGRSSAGVAGSIQEASNNTIIGCTTGISDISKTGDTVIANNNLILSATTGIRSDAVGTFTKNKNNLSSCATPHSGVGAGSDTFTTVTLDADYVPSTLLTGTAQQPDVDYNGNYANSIVGATNKANQHIVGYFI